MKRYKIWVELEEIEDLFGAEISVSGGALGFLPDCLGMFEGRDAKGKALTHLAKVVSKYGLDPEKSDCVQFVKRTKGTKGTA